MRKRLLSVLLIVLLSISVLPAAGVDAAETAACADYSGSNENAQNYTTWADTIKSYLTVCEDGSLMRFQYANGNEGYVAEYYDASYQLLRIKKINVELPVFGGFYAGGDNYFILTGQTNKEQSATVECYRITKYDKDWKRLGSVGLYDCNTTIPFRAGSARFAENGDFLLIRTCHEMYTSSDGLNHQANVTIQLNKGTMQIINSYVKVEHHPYGYVSHSFNQFIKNDNGKIVSVDHGDAYPRAVVIMESDGNTRNSTNYTALEIPGEIGDNYTGVSVGGFEFSDTAWLVAGNKVDFNSSNTSTRNIFISVVSKADGAVTLKQITNYGVDDKKVSTPHFVKTGANEFILLWSLGDSVFYAWIDGSGNLVGKIYEMEGCLSDCVPLVYNGKLVWYTWVDSAISFYEIDLENTSKNSKILVDIGHNWECKNVKNHIASLQCVKCGKKKTVDTPESLTVWWQKQDNTDGYYWSAFSNPFQTGDYIKYWVRPVSKEEASSREESRDFLFECSDPDAMQIQEDTESHTDGFGVIRFQKPGQYTLTVRHIYDDSLTKEYTFVVKGEPEAVELNKKSITLNPGKTYELKASPVPEEAETTYSWTSSNKKVATVKSGKVTAVG
ncbi:MAG: Ig-like domain-containing protein, partial [Lachnospiraceae bacterium]|nr:Ig-like domain-containing protein [Lachnospiraceae bacterium]